LDPVPAIRSAVATVRAKGAAVLHVAPRTANAGPDSQVALAAIANAATAIMAATGVRRLMVTGGETARALCDTAGIRALRVLGDVEPGLVLAESEGSKEPWLLAIKPGGFGSEASWVRALDALTKGRSKKEEG
jgi:D-threonate/D-erythronate kinase